MCIESNGGGWRGWGGVMGVQPGMGHNAILENDNAILENDDPILEIF